MQHPPLAFQSGHHRTGHDEKEGRRGASDRDHDTPVIGPALFWPAGVVAREAGEAARGFLWRGAPAVAEELIGLIGTGFLVLCGICRAASGVTRPVLAAPATGAVLIALAAVLAQISGQMDTSRKPGGAGAQNPVQPPAPATPPKPQDAETVAAFPAAFVLGRWLADDRRE